jgi:O-acetyl-ADP-ribose deacetylase (regulator of RNase III)
MSLNYIKGDATHPIKEHALICHVCNNVGGWGKGFVLALSKRWPEPERAYRDWFDGIFEEPQIIDDKQFKLGNVQFVPILTEGNNFWVANMIAQNNTRKRNDLSDKVYIDYDTLNITLDKTFKFAKEKQLTVHMPRIGCGLAGGKWDLIEPLLEVAAKNIGTYIYDFEQ